MARKRSKNGGNTKPKNSKKNTFVKGCNGNTAGGNCNENKEKDTVVSEIPEIVISDDTPTDGAETSVTGKDSGGKSRSENNSASDPVSDVESPKGKKETEQDARKNKKEDSEPERQNEKEDVTSSDAPEPEKSTTGEASKPTPENGTDSTTDKVEPEKKEKNTPPSMFGKYKVPTFMLHMYDKGWLKTKGAIKHPETGNHIPIFATNQLDAQGNPVEIDPVCPEEPSLEGLDEQAQKAVTAQFYAELSEYEEELEKTIKRKGAIFKKIEGRLYDFLTIHLKKVHCWNGKKDKALNIVGIAMGLKGGRDCYVVMVNGTDENGSPKMFMRGFKHISTTLPEGEPALPKKPLIYARDVEAREDQKLLENKSSAPIKVPLGYKEAIENLSLEEDYRTILVWNNYGQQLSFTPVPVEGQDDMFEWACLDLSEEGKIAIHNDAINMAGSIPDLLRTTVKVNQEGNKIDNMLVVSIPVRDKKTFYYFMEIMGSGAIGDTNGEEGKQ